MTDQEASDLVECLARNDPKIQQAIAKEKEKGVSWLELAIRMQRAARRIAREID